MRKLAQSTWMVALAHLLWVAVAHGRSGVLDPGFGRGGLVRADLSAGEDAARALVVRPDGSILLAGPAGADAAVVAFLPDGRVDRGFGREGVARVDLGGREEAAALALGPDGTIAVAGTTVAPRRRPTAWVLRLDPEGGLDRAFGAAGRAPLGLGGAAQAEAVAVADDGSLLAAGFTGTGPNERPWLVRLTPQGRLDPDFGLVGRARLDFLPRGARATALAVRRDGGVVVAGHVEGDFFVVSVSTHGSVDRDFGEEGVARVDFDGRRDRAYAVGLTKDDHIVVVGGTERASGADFAIAVLEPSGKPHARFDRDGRLRVDFGGFDVAHSLVRDADDRLVVAGQTDTEEGSDMALVRLLPGGDLDLGFGREGRVRTDLESPADGAFGLAVQPGGRLLVAGRRGEARRGEIALVGYHDAAAQCGDGWVDDGEECDLAGENGATSCCSEVCQLRREGDVCRPSEGLCDPAEVCSGTSPACPADEIAPAEKVCRSAVGWCDLSERCSGVKKTCPADRVRDRDAVCRSAVGPCDAAERCDGESVACPADEKATDICRPARGDCDLPERCDGVQDACPPDRLQPNGNACYDRNPCTVDEVCLDGVCGGGVYEPFSCAGLLCRGWRVTDFSDADVSEEDREPELEDEIEGRLEYQVRNPLGPRTRARSYLCGRASLNGEWWPESEEIETRFDFEAPPRHRLSVALKGPATASRLLLSDRFGSRSVAVRAKRRLSVSAIPLRAAVESPAALTPDRRKCYAVREAVARHEKRVPVWLEADPLLFDVRRLAQVCVPVGMNEEAPTGRVAVSCYVVQRSKGQPRASSAESLEVETDNGVWFELREAGQEVLCVPAVVTPLRHPIEKVSSR